MTPARTQLVAEYLRRLDNACALLPPPRRQELRQEISEHIDAAMDEEEILDADAVRAILERLGPPADIVAAELRTTPAKGLPAVGAGHLPAAGDRPAPPAHAPQAPVPGAEPHGSPATGPRGRVGSTVRAAVLGAAAASAVLFAILFSFSSHDTVRGGGSPSAGQPSVQAPSSEAPVGSGVLPPPPFTSPAATAPNATAPTGPASPWSPTAASGTP